MTAMTYLWWNRNWHRLLYRNYIVEPFFRFITKIGLWRVEEADYYNNGKLQFPDMWTRWRGGEDIDRIDEGGSGLPHLSHAACCLCFLITYRARNLGTDDRKEVKLIG